MADYKGRPWEDHPPRRPHPGLGTGGRAAGRANEDDVPAGLRLTGRERSSWKEADWEARATEEASRDSRNRPGANALSFMPFSLLFLSADVRKGRVKKPIFPLKDRRGCAVHPHVDHRAPLSTDSALRSVGRGRRPGWTAGGGRLREGDGSVKGEPMRQQGGRVAGGWPGRAGERRVNVLPQQQEEREARRGPRSREQRLGARSD